MRNSHVDTYGILVLIDSHDIVGTLNWTVLGYLGNHHGGSGGAHIHTEFKY